MTNDLSTLANLFNPSSRPDLHRHRLHPQLLRGRPLMPEELRLPTNVADLSQETYERYVLQVKAILRRFPNAQILLVREELTAVSRGVEIVSVPQTTGGILIQLRRVSTKIDEAIALYEDLSESERKQFFAAIED